MKVRRIGLILAAACAAGLSALTVRVECGKWVNRVD